MIIWVFLSLSFWGNCCAYSLDVAFEFKGWVCFELQLSYLDCFGTKNFGILLIKRLLLYSVLIVFFFSPLFGVNSLSLWLLVLSLNRSFSSFGVLSFVDCLCCYLYILLYKDESLPQSFWGCCGVGRIEVVVFLLWVGLRAHSTIVDQILHISSLICKVLYCGLDPNDLQSPGWNPIICKIRAFWSLSELDSICLWCFCTCWPSYLVKNESVPGRKKFSFSFSCNNKN